jgi:hypothetical protein
MAENENPNGGREIAVLPRSIKRSDEVRYRHLATARDLPEAHPEAVFKADARPATANDDKSLFQCRIHGCISARLPGLIIVSLLL